MEGGRLTVPDRPGLGVDVLPERLRELTIRLDEVRPTH